MTVVKEDKHHNINSCNDSKMCSIAEAESVANGFPNNNSVLSPNDIFDVSYPRHKEVDIEFRNIRYNVRKFSFSEKKFIAKEILHGISGVFRSGELTAIMGPSGSGKSTLLNVMTGYKSIGVSGTVQINGVLHQTSTEKFRQLSCYIHQNDLVRPMLTVGETMNLAANLKLGYKVSKEYKLSVVKKILVLLGLDDRYNVYAYQLSGGQKKRLTIALELLSNPPVLYLDEPTTGLDSSSCIQCVSLLKRLALQGHTVVCTIHQPSALIFEMFDKLFTIAEGNCIYQGPARELVPFLGDLGLHCPSYHNPADYLMEVAVGEHDRDMNKLINAAAKKYYEDSDLHQLGKVNQLISNIQGPIEVPVLKKKGSKNVVDYENIKCSGKSLTGLLEGDTDNIKRQNNALRMTEAASVWMQYILLLRRNFTCSRRSYFILSARVLSHIIIGIIFGYLYLNVGPTATTVFGNYVYLYGTILLIVYTGKMAVVLSFPLEMNILRREHFNRWYKLGPYFLSVISFEIPFQTLCVSLYIVISSYLTGNISENFRFFYFLLMGVMATLSAQAWGFFVGATLPLKLAVFIGPILAVLFSVFGFCTRYVDITPMFRWMWHISYFRAGFHGALNAIYGLDRAFLKCPDKQMYCHFRSPKVFLKQMMISDVSMTDSISLMVGIIILMYILTIFTLWYKLTKR